MKKKPIEIAKVLIDGIGMEKCKFSFKSKNKNTGQSISIKNHEEGVKFVLEMLVKNNVIKKLAEISRIGHRVVHGGEKYKNSVKIDANVMKAIEKLSNLAPLHNPVNLASIKACKKFLPKVKQIAVFDTAFHQTMPEKAYLYGLPYRLYKDWSIRRYGFHGTSHKYVTKEALKLMKTFKAKIVSCHIGNGSSITATINGKSIDTSMGFTPLEGVIMGTRCGSIDPAIIFHLQENLKMKPASVDHLLNFDSGLKGLSGISSDMRDIYQKSLKGNAAASLTIEILSYQIAKYIGAYASAMNGLNAIIFTGGLTEHAFYVRQKVCGYLKFLGVKLDQKKNKKITVMEISEKRSKIKVFVIKTNEEIQIAEESRSL